VVGNTKIQGVQPDPSVFSDFGQDSSEIPMFLRFSNSAICWRLSDLAFVMGMTLNCIHTTTINQSINQSIRRSLKWELRDGGLPNLKYLFICLYIQYINEIPKTNQCFGVQLSKWEIKDTVVQCSHYSILDTWPRYRMHGR